MLQLKKLSHTIKGELKETFVPRTVVSIVLGTAITTFGLYNVHQQADITEGGILGLILLLNFWLGVSSSMLSPVLDCLCLYGRLFSPVGAVPSGSSQSG